MAELIIEEKNTTKTLSFTLFPQLPAELRIKIIEYAFLYPSLISFSQLCLVCKEFYVVSRNFRQIWKSHIAQLNQLLTATVEYDEWVVKFFKEGFGDCRLYDAAIENPYKAFLIMFFSRFFDRCKHDLIHPKDGVTNILVKYEELAFYSLFKNQRVRGFLSNGDVSNPHITRVFDAHPKLISYSEKEEEILGNSSR